MSDSTKPLRERLQKNVQDVKRRREERKKEERMRQLKKYFDEAEQQATHLVKIIEASTACSLESMMIDASKCGKSRMLFEILMETDSYKPLRIEASYPVFNGHCEGVVLGNASDRVFLKAMIDDATPMRTAVGKMLSRRMEVRCWVLSNCGHLTIVFSWEP